MRRWTAILKLAPLAFACAASLPAPAWALCNHQCQRWRGPSHRRSPGGEEPEPLRTRSVAGGVVPHGAGGFAQNLKPEIQCSGRCGSSPEAITASSSYG